MEIMVDGRSRRVFLGGMIPFRGTEPVPPHKHYHVELHLIMSGAAEYVVGDQHYIVGANDYVVIPGTTFHWYTPMEDFSFQGFQIERFDTQPAVGKMSADQMEILKQEYVRARETLCCGRLAACLGNLLYPLLCEDNQKLIPLQNRRYMIHEFLASNYNRDITLAEVAEHINLSPKQTARLIEEYTGHPFRQQIPYLRVEAAECLVETGRMTLEEVAQQVGYQSYSSLWKAYHKQESERRTESDEEENSCTNGSAHQNGDT